MIRHGFAAHRVARRGSRALPVGLSWRRAMSVVYLRQTGRPRTTRMCYLKSGEPTGTPNDCCISGLRPTVTPQTAQSVLYQAYQALQANPGRIVARSSADGQRNTLAQYAAKCDTATGITVPSFNWSASVAPAGQGSGSTCSTPNVLNGTSDPVGL